MTKELTSFGDLAANLIKDTLRVMIMAEAGLGHAAKIVQSDAKNRIGEYQEGTGPFPAWKPLAESTERQKELLGYGRDEPLLREGDLRESIVTEHNAMEAVVGSKMPIAKYQEFGTDAIPPRPFIGPAAFQNQGKIARTIGEFAMAGIAGGAPVLPGLGYDS